MLLLLCLIKVLLTCKMKLVSIDLLLLILSYEVYILITCVL